MHAKHVFCNEKPAHLDSLLTGHLQASPRLHVVLRLLVQTMVAAASALGIAC